MAEEGPGASAATEARWTCEACGCHTNTEADDPLSCGVCGTRRAPSLLRRSVPSSARIVHGGLSRGFGHHHDDDAEEQEEDDEEEEDGPAPDQHEEDEDDDGEEMGTGDGTGDEDEQAAALEAAGVSDSSRALGRSGSRMLRAVAAGSGSAALSLLGAPSVGSGREAARTRPTSSRNRQTAMNPEELLSVATENSGLYQPRWADPAQIGGRHHGAIGGARTSSSGGAVNGIMVDSEGYPNVAHLPEGAGEGRAVRASTPLPRGTQTSARTPPTAGGSSSSPQASGAAPQERKRKRAYGFRVAFDHPGRETGRSMGGCYLVGVTTSSFASYGERSGLQQSRLFWGIEDGGRRYEGSTSSAASRRRQNQSSAPGPPSRGGSSSHGVQLGRGEAPRNADNVLFGSREVITVVVDLDSRTLTYWRDGRILGTLVSNLPRAGNLYPVAVPFNAGVSVAVTGLDGEPLSTLADFHIAQKRLRREKDDLRRLTLAEQRSKLIQDGRPTLELLSVLRTIFSWYQVPPTDASTPDDSCGLDVNADRLDAIASARLWYRCGMKLSHLRSLLDKSGMSVTEGIAPSSPYVRFDDFANVVRKIVGEEEDDIIVGRSIAESMDTTSVSTSALRPGSGGNVPSPPMSLFEVGDRVEVSEGYEKFGDAASGPLHPGDRGTVLEVQRGPRGDRQSVRVVHNGRRWWYQPQALLSERSGLVETPAVRFLRTVLRSHGFDHTTLQPLWGKNVTPDSWQLGDLVVPLRAPPKRKRAAADGRTVSANTADWDLVGRIVAEPSSSLASASSRGKEAGMVTVEFVNSAFGIAAGLLGGSAAHGSSSSFFTRRFKARHLIHTTFYHGTSVINTPVSVNDPLSRDTLAMESDNGTKVVDETMTASNDGEDKANESDAEEEDELGVGQSEEESFASPLVVNEKLKANIGNLAKLDASAVNAVAKECGRNSASLAGMFAAGLPDAILCGIDCAEEQLAGSTGTGKGAGDLSAISALGELAVSIVKQLFAEKKNAAFGSTPAHILGTPSNDEENQLGNQRDQPLPDQGVAPGLRAVVPPSPFGGVASHPFRQEGQSADSATAGLLLPHQDRPGNGPPPFGQQVSVRDFIRDLSGTGGPSSAEQRRSVLLALMASARMSDDAAGPSSSNAGLARGGGSNMAMAIDGDYQLSAAQQRGRQILSSFGRLSAEAAMLGAYGGVPPSVYNQQRQLAPQLDELGGAIMGQGGGLGFGLAGNDATVRAPSGIPPAGGSTSPSSLPSSGGVGTTSGGAPLLSQSANNSTQHNAPLLDSLVRGSGDASSTPLSVTRGGSSRGAGGLMSASTKALIRNGLLNNSLVWVKKTLGVKGAKNAQSPSGAAPVDVQSARDEDGTPPLLLAISLGCSSSILETLIRSGAQVGEREIREAAITDQPLALTALLRHSVYCEGTFDLQKCSSEVIEVLTKAGERQRVQEERMRSDSGVFVACLLRKLVRLGLRYRLLRGQGYSDFARAVSEALAGDVLLHAMHKSQHKGLAMVASRSGETSPPPPGFSAEDGRVPAFSGTSGPSSGSGTPPFATPGSASGSTQTAPNPPPSSPVGLLYSLPPRIIHNALTEETNAAGSPRADASGLPTENQHDANSSMTALTDFLRLTESYLWSKDVRDAAVGLTLATTLLQKVPSLCVCGEIDRYGIKDLAMSHAALADEALADIELNQSPPTCSDKGGVPSPQAAAAAAVGVVLCPKQHTTVLHLTRHSSFRCDLCGKGVDRGRPMHGCRECDWDACESCTDKAEGGIVKWGCVRDLAIECQHLILTLQGRQEEEEEEEDGYSRAVNEKMQQQLRLSSSSDDLQRCARGIRQRNLSSLHDLAAMLEIPGKITLHEFSSCLLPVLHSSLVGGKHRVHVQPLASKDQSAASKGVSPRRRSKKPRVGGTARKKDDPKTMFLKGQRPGSALVRSGGTSKEEEDREAFLRAAIDALILDPKRRAAKSSGSPSSIEDGPNDEETAGEEQMAVVHMDDPHDDEEEDEESDDESAEVRRTSANTQSKKTVAVVPEIVRRIHGVLGFNERVIVIQHNTRGNPENNSSGGGGGELQALTLPFEIELCPSAASGASNVGPLSASAGHLQDHSMSLEGASTGHSGNIVHVEPLMPMAELQLHVLRTCRIHVPKYIRFCRRLALDRAIIAEMPSAVSHMAAKGVGGGTASNDKDGSRRIAQIVAFDEATGAHVVRYASHFLTSQGAYGVGDEELVYGDQPLCNQLEFHDRESMLILAARDYFILHRDRTVDEENGAHFDMDSEGLLTDGMTQSNMSVDLCAPNVPSFASTNPDAAWALGQYGEYDRMRADDEPVSRLPIGMRVESDIGSSDGSWTVYTVISSESGSISNSDAEQANVMNSALQSNSCPRYGLVSDSGEVFVRVPGDKVRNHDASLHQRRLQHQRDREQRANQLMQRQSSQEGDALESTSARGSHLSIFDRSVPIASVRRATSAGSHSSDHSDGGAGRSQTTSTPAVGVLKRTWSALSPLQKMSPLELSISSGGCVDNASGSSSGESSNARRRKLSIGGSDVELDIDFSAVEKQPFLRVDFSLHDTLPTVALSCMEETTLHSGLQRLLLREKATRRQQTALERKRKVFFSVAMFDDYHKTKGEQMVYPSVQKDISLPSTFTPPWTRPRVPTEMNRCENEQFDSVVQRSSAHSAGNSHPFDLPQGIVADQEMDLSLGMQSDMHPGKNMWSFSSTVNKSSTGRENGFDISSTSPLCDGMNDACMQCMELLCIMAENSVESHLEEKNSLKDPQQSKEDPGKDGFDAESLLSVFESEALTKKLVEQLDDPLTVVGGALPDWCTAAPAFAPHVFSHSSRCLLVERAAFGVSRSALKQQEAKVAVGPLRQRMAALRGRAVELVGEAFSGGAADPTALQLQADELYGMEEALAARVSAAFRAQRWDERSLQCAKAAVRRDALLTDAAAVMEHYASDDRVKRRRLEVRFEGESGFDAASGDEAGVTRGFYADVAEALLSCDHVAGVLCPPLCPKDIIEPSLRGGHSSINVPIRHQNAESHQVKLPLWIPDMDSSRKVVIPTPRADPSSGLGVYPRPMSAHHPHRAAVLGQFRFMGRLFAAALRDGFVFPLPLSTSFLKLVQSQICIDPGVVSRQSSSSSSTSSVLSTDYLSNNSSSLPSSVSSSPVPNSMMSIEDASNGFASSVENTSSFGDGKNDVFIPGAYYSGGSLVGGNSDGLYSSPYPRNCRHGSLLTSLDLPRPGFLGGEVYAVERQICVALDKLDEAEPVLSREIVEKRRQEIASDKSFARKALGKSYDCSFEEFFEDRSFVDPLDPTQGEDAIPLCPNGHLRSVTINNVREWVMLAKQFILHDGVIAQAHAFRRGVEDFFSADALRLFTAEELQRNVCGGGDNVDSWDEDAIRSLFKLDGGKGAAEALVAVAAMGGEGGAALSRRFGPSSPTVGYLVKALLEANPTQRRQFLSFVTSVPIVTPGQIEVVPVVNPAGDFLPMSDPACLPRANTCARRLYLPKFESYESFAHVLWAVVREESRFKGFYEWRG